MSLIKASDDIKFSSDGVAYITSYSYYEVKRLTITDQYIGTFRVIFDLEGSNYGYLYAYAKIYYNGSPIGTERVKVDMGYETFTEDFSNIRLKNGDIIAVWGYIPNPSGGKVKNFRVEFDLIMPDNSMFAVF